MTAGSATQLAAPRPRLVGQLTRFVVVGVLSAGVDFGVYQALLHLGLWVDLAKACSFVLGTTTAYLLNRRWTFRARGSRRQAVGFWLLYCVTFFVNVGVNAGMVHVLAGNRWQYSLAWLVAQAVATVINFVLLRAVVFRQP